MPLPPCDHDACPPTGCVHQQLAATIAENAKLLAENIEANGRLDMQMKDLAQLRGNFKRVSDSYDAEIQRLASLRDLVTTNHETKEAFIARVSAIINA